MKTAWRICGIVLVCILLHRPAHAAFPIKTATPIVATTTTETPIAATNNTITNTTTAHHGLLTRMADHFYHYRQQKPRYRSMAILFCIVCLGLHRLYLGYTYTGLAQLAGEVIGIAALLSFAYFGSTLVLGMLLYYSLAMLVWQVIDLINLLRGKLPPKHGYYTNDHRLWRRHRHGAKNGF